MPDVGPILPLMSNVAVVTDSSACLSGQVAAAHGITVVPLQVVIDGTAYDDGVDAEAAPDRIAAALKAHRKVTTSRSSPQRILELYERLTHEGAEEIVSVHLSSRMSATYDSAVVAAREAPVPVRTVDTLQIGPATGFAALDAARAARRGASAEVAASLALNRASAAVSLFSVTSLEWLRRGGRVGTATALLGSALAVKPLLHIADGGVAALEKVRTSARALSRLEELATQHAAGRRVDVVVSHLDAEETALGLARRLGERLGVAAGQGLARVRAGEGSGPGTGTPQVVQVPAVLAAHVGPGLVGVTVAPLVG